MIESEGGTGKSANHRSVVRPSTDDSLRFVWKGTGACSTYHIYHDGKPGCGMGTDKDRKPDAWPLERAAVWRRACRHCYKGGVDPQAEAYLEQEDLK